jgi:hypothetical protein
MLGKGVCLSVFLNLIFIFNSDATTGGTGSIFENLPAVAMDYKVHIDAGELKEKFKLKMHLPIVNVFINISSIKQP